MKKLYSPLGIKDIELRNRIAMAPMCMFSAGDDGKATPWHAFHYRTRAQGGAGLIIQEATAVEARGRISAADLGLWCDDQIPGMAQVVRGIEAEGAVPAIQLAHAGRKCHAPGEDVIAPSPLIFDPEDPKDVTPREMSPKDIDVAVESFARSAERAAEAGYRLLELHGAHGYLINEFLSPLTNKRNDEFGGSHAGRAEFLKRIIKAVRRVWPMEHPLMLRVSALDYHPDGNRPEDLARMINLVKGEGLDMIHVSTGGVVPGAKIPLGPEYQIPAAWIIREETELPVIGGGLITDAVRADAIIDRGDADLVFFGRELLRNPYFPLLSAREAGVDLDYWPEPYRRAVNK